jgi:ketosteroid isomerase-like protein
MCARRLFARVAVVVIALGLTGCVIQPIQPDAAAPASAVASLEGMTDEEQAALAVVEKLASVGARHPMSLDTLDEYTSLYSDDAVLTVLGSPNYLDLVPHQGIEAIHQRYADNEAIYKETVTWQPIVVEGDTVIARRVEEFDDPALPGVHRAEATDIFEIGDGKIVREIMAVDPDSLAAMLNAVTVNAHLWKPGAADKPWLDPVLGAASPFKEAGIADAAEEWSQWYADDASVSILGLPWGPEVYTGKEALMTQVEGWLANNERWEKTPLMVISPWVTVKTRTWSDGLEGLGIAPVTALSVYEVEGGKIQNEYWVLTPNSLEALMGALAAMEDAGEE